MVSVIVTSYNYERYVERAIRSCLDQSLPKSQYEVIVINDCSTDNTKKVLENYASDIRIYNLDTNIGLAAARNLGVKKARGQFVMFLDADDYIHHELLSVLQLFLTENNSLDAVASDYLLVDERGNHIEHVSAEKKPIACGIMFRKDFIIDIGLYDESFRAREEEDLRIRFLKKYNIYNIILPLYRYRRHGENLTDNKQEMDKYKSHLDNKHNRG